LKIKIMTIKEIGTPAFPGKAFICFLLVVINLIVYGQTIEFPFSLYDDGIYAAHNPHVLSGLTWSNIVWALVNLEAGFWHPLTWLSLMVDGHLYGTYAGGYHLTNVFLHIGNTLLLFLIMRRLLGGEWRGALVAALFAIHPLHVEPVVWISSRKDVLSTFFWMLTMYFYIWYANRPDWGRYTLVLFCFACGLMAKPMIVTLPLVLLILDNWPLGRRHVGMETPWGRLAGRHIFHLLLEKLPLMIMAAMSIIVTVYAEKGVGALVTADRLSFPDRAANMLVSYVTYLVKMIWPVNMAVFYPHPGQWPAWQVAASGGVIVALTILSFCLRKKYPHVAVGWLWYLISLAPVSGILQVGAHAMADRYTYIPFIGLFWLAACSLPHRLQGWRRQSMIVALIILLTTLTAVAWRQALYWGNDLTLFRHAIAVTKNNYIAEANLASALMTHGDDEAAINHFQRSIAIKPNYEPAYYGMGVLLKKKGQDSAALRCFEAVLAIEPRFFAAYIQMGDLHFRNKKYSEASKYYRKAIQLSPPMNAPWNLLGVALMHEMAYAEAMHALRKALNYQPDHAGIHNNLAMAYLAVGKTENAIAHFQEAISRQPDYANAHYNLALALRKTGRHEEAKIHETKAASINPAYAGRPQRGPGDP